MPGLAAPVWLAALAAIAVPVAIHLLTRRPARLVRIGSIRHLADAPTRARQLRLDDPWLLALRAAILGAVAAALAAPFLTHAAQPSPRAWLLVDPALLPHSDPALDSLRAAGITPRLFAPGMPEVPWDADPGIVAAFAQQPGPADAWSLLREADRLAPPGTALHVVAPPVLPSDAGERPRIRRAVTWHPPAVRDPFGAGRLPPAAPDSPPAATIMAAPGRRDDARYLAAALRAAGAGATRVLPPDSAAALAARVRAGDWIVWLADAPVPAALEALAAAGAVLLTDGAETARDGAAPAIVAADGVPPVVLPHVPGADPAPGDGAVLWQDAAGRALLVARRVGAGLRLDHAGRFVPASTGLVLDPAFPELIARLWNAPALGPGMLPVSVAQILPARELGDRAERPVSGPAAPRTDLGVWVWLVAAALLLAERLVVARRGAR